MNEIKNFSSIEYLFQKPLISNKELKELHEYWMKYTFTDFCNKTGFIDIKDESE